MKRRKKHNHITTNYNKFQLYKMKPTTSGLETKFEKEVMKKIGYEYTRQVKLMSKSFDFGIMDIKLLIEVDGDYWHGKTGKLLNSMQRKNKNNDKDKNLIASNSGFHLIRFSEKDIMNRISLVRLRLISKIMSLKSEK